jgi:hypothetical protein
MRETNHGVEYEGETFLTVEQIAMMLRIRPHEVESYINNGELISQVIDKSTMISETNLEEFLETHIFPARWIGGDGY